MGFVFQAARANLVKVFYAFQDSKTPMINGMISIVCNITLSFLLSKFIGISGVSLATSIAMMIATILLLRDVKNYLPGFSVKSCFSEIRKGITALILSVVVLLLVKEVVNLSTLICLIIEGVVVVTVYGTILFCLKSKSIGEALDYIKRRT